MITPSPPSMNPSNRFDLAGTFRLLFTKWLQGVDDMLPAKVIAYDRETNRAQVQPLIVVVTTDNKIVPRVPIASVPVLQLGGGGFVMSFPIKTGDLGWIKANDRDVSLFFQSLAESAPNTARKHSFEDCIFIPDTMFKDVVIDGEDADNLVIQTLAGDVKISLSEDSIKIIAPAAVIVECDTATVTAASTAQVTSPEITLTASTSVTLDTPETIITGNLVAGAGGGSTAVFNGSFTATGEIKTDLAGGINLSTHKHNGVQPGGGNSGGPIP